MNNNDVEVIEEVMYAMMARCTNGDYPMENYVPYREYLIKSKKYDDIIPKELRKCRSLDQFWTIIQPMFKHYSERKQYLLEIFSPMIERAELASFIPSDEITTKGISELGEGYINDEWSKALSRRDTDPEGAVTSARALLESTCKYILDKENIQYDKTDGVKLVNLVLNELNLLAKDHVDPMVKRILGGCNTITNGIFELRNNVGDSHGQGIKKYKPKPRHAMLAVNSAGMLSVFLLETYNEKKSA